jgi:hypothetical protein
MSGLEATAGVGSEAGRDETKEGTITSGAGVGAR